MNATDYIDQYYSHFIAKEWELFAEKLSEDFTYVTDGAIEQTKKEFVDFLREDKWEGRGHSMSQLKENESDDGSLVTCSYSIEFFGKLNGSQFDVFALETMVLRRRGDGWQVAHCHVSNRM